MDSIGSRGATPPHPKSLRMFYALWPDERARERLATLAADVARRGGGRAVALDNLHVTLAFIGGVAPDRLDALREAGRVAAHDAAAIDISLDRLGGAHDGELVWIAPAAAPAPLATLFERLGHALEARGFAPERRAFRPHLTLARRCARPVARTSVEPIAWRIARLTLMASTTRPEGSQYREIASWPLDSTER